MPLFYFLCVPMLIPHVSVGSIEIGVDDIIAGALLCGFVPIVSEYSDTRWRPLILLILLLWIVVIVHGLVLGSIASIEILGYLDLPTEMWQYIKRLAFFCAALVLAERAQVRAKQACLTILITLLFAAVIGAAQIPDSAVGQILAQAFARTEHQLSELVEDPLSTRRIFGIAGHPVSWGGFSMFTAAVALPFFLTGASTKRDMRWRVISMLLFGLATVNVLFSASRAALGAFLVVVISKPILEMVFRHGGMRVASRWIIAVIAVSGAAAVFAFDRLMFFLFRLAVLSQGEGGRRVDQVRSGFDLLDSPVAWITGVGNAVQRTRGVSYGVEVEPAYLVVNYGLFGAGARYLLLAVIVAAGFRLMRSQEFWESCIGMATVLAVAGYVVFSFGYFFFQELYVGVVPWVLFGVTAGLYQRLGNGLTPERIEFRRVKVYGT